MKKILLILTINLLTINGHCQNQTWQWAKNAISNPFAAGNQGQKIKVVTSGNVYVMGNFLDDSLVFGPVVIHNTLGGGNENVYLLKCNASGDFIWGKSIGIGYLTGYGFDIDVSENCYISGVSNTNLIIGLDTFNNGGMFIAKFDSAGNPIWAKSTSSGSNSSSSEGDGVSIDNIGNIYVFGSYYGDSITIGSITVHTIYSNLYQDLFLAKFDSSGNTTWIKLGWGAANYAKDVTTDAFGNVFITGFFSGNFIIFDSITIYDNHPQWTDVFIAKYDSSGNIKWAKSEGGNSNNGDEGWTISTDAFGNSYIGGLFTPNSTFDTIYLNTYGGFLIAFSPTGDLLWLKDIVSSPLQTIVFGVATDTFGNEYVTGDFQGDSITFDSITLYNTFNINSAYTGVFLAKYDHNGTIIWAKQGIGNGQGIGICSDISGDVYISGDITDTMTFGSFVLPGYNYTSFIAKLGATTGVEEYKKDNGGVSVYPNPVSTELTFHTELGPSRVGYELRIIDVLGREVYHSQFSTLNSQLITIDVSGFSNGVYFYQVTNDKETYRGKFVVEK